MIRNEFAREKFPSCSLHFLVIVGEKEHRFDPLMIRKTKQTFLVG